ncbi:MAG: serine/threonine-protein kinase [Myxococcota bacterium]
MGRDATTGRSSQSRAADDPDQSAKATLSVGRVAANSDEAPANVAIGDSVGRYVVLQEVGQGGMGRVLRAYDPRLQREVALKVLRPNALSDEASSRLAAEARAMAQVAHPNVVPIYDVDVEDGQIILVMQYVAGTTLRAWIRGEPSWRDVVDRYVLAGRGLAAAHAVGLLHRDFKPANVLLAEDGAVKVTDFGLAKPAANASRSRHSLDESSSSSDRLTRSDTMTQAGTVLGTPRYMAPEQHGGLVLTPAADQFAFCVALWEALQHAAPYSGARLGRQKREGPPAWPGGPVPRRIADAIRRGLSPLPSERWPSMDALLDRIADDPVARRTRRIAFGGAAVVAVVGSVLGWRAYQGPNADICDGAEDELETAWGDSRQEAADEAVMAEDTPYARVTWERARGRIDSYAQRWVELHDDACESTAVRGVQSAAVMDLRMACLRDAEVGLRAVTGVLANADREVRENMDSLLDTLPDLGRCSDVVRLQAEVEPPPPDVEDRVREARGLLAEASAESNGGRYKAAQLRVDDARAELLGVDYAPAVAELALAEGMVSNKLGHYEDAVEALRRAVRQSATTGQRDLLLRASTELMYVLGRSLSRFDEGLALRQLAEGLAEGRPLDEADVANTVALVLLDKGSLKEAEAVQRRAYALRNDALGERNAAVANSRHTLALLLTAQSKHAEALEEHQAALEIWNEALGPEHPNVTMSMSNIATTYFHLGDYEASEKAHRDALALRIRALGPEHPEVLTARNNLALTLCKQGQWSTCELELKRTLDAQAKQLGEESRDRARTFVNLGVALQAQGRFEEAAEANREGLRMCEKVLGPNHSETAVVRINIANDLARTGMHAEAAAEYRKALSTLETALGPEHSSVAIAVNNLAAMLEEQDDFAGAEVQYRKALKIRLATIGEEHPLVASVRTSLARVLLAQGNDEEALVLAEQGWRRLESDASPNNRGEGAFVLARALSKTTLTKATRARIVELLEAAAAAFEDANAPDDVEAVAQWREKNARRIRA